MSGPIRPPLRVKEVDGSPNVIPVNTIRVSDGTLTDNTGGVVTVATGSGGGGSMSSFDVAGNTGPSQTVSDGETLTIQGGSSGADIKVTMSANDTATIDLQTTGVSAGSYTLASITVDANGRITSASSGSVSVPSGANPTASVGATATNGSATTFMRSDASPALETTGVSAGSYTLASITVDATGRLTSASSGSASTSFPLEAPNGSFSAPSYSFSTDTDTGMFRYTDFGNAVLSFANGGSRRLNLRHDGTIQFNDAYTFPASDGSANQVLQTDGAGTLSFATLSTGGSPGGTDGQVQYNNGGSFGGMASMTYDDTADAEQILISDSSSSALLKIVQTGSGNCFEVHDQASDTSIFQILPQGKVVVGFQAGVTPNDPFYVVGSMFTDAYKSGSGSTATPSYGRSTGSKGMYFPSGGNDVAFTANNSEKLRITEDGEIGIGGENYGTSGQVLTSGGAGSAVSWTTVSGGGGIDSSAGNLKIQKSATGSNITQYPLFTQWGDGTSSSNGVTSFNTSFATLFPFFGHKTGDIQSITCNIPNAGSTSDDDWLVRIYDVDSNNLPQNAIGSEVTWDMGNSGNVTVDVSSITDTWNITAGDMYYIAILMKSADDTRPTVRTYSDADTGVQFNLPYCDVATAQYNIFKSAFKLTNLSGALPSSVTVADLISDGAPFVQIPVIGVAY